MAEVASTTMPVRPPQAPLRLPAAASLSLSPRRADQQPTAEFAAVAALVALAALLRVPTLTRAYWVDEGISIGIASHRLSQIPGLLHRDGSPPVFYVLLHFWLRLFGAAPASTHSLSLLTSLLVVPVAWWCARSLFGTRVAISAAVLAATSPFLNWYATETRMYPLVCGLAMIAVTFSVLAVQRHSLRDGFVAVAAFVALLYTHNWSLYLGVVTAGLLFGRAFIRRDRRQAVWIVAGSAVVITAYLPWLQTVLYQAHHTAAPWAIPPTVADLFTDPASAVGGTLGVVIGPLLGVGAIVNWLYRTSDANRTIALVGGIGLLTVLSGWLAAQLEPSWASRYLAVALGPLLIAFAGCLGGSWLGRRIIAGAALVLVGWSIVGSLLPDSNARYAKSNVAAVAAAARPFLGPGDVVVVAQTEQLAVLAHYLPAGLRFVTPTGLVTDPTVVDWRDLVARLRTADVCRTVATPIDGLPVGAHVLLVDPYQHLGAPGTAWSQAVNDQVLGVNELMAFDPGVTQLRTLAPATRPKPYSAVFAILYARTKGPATCP